MITDGQLDRENEIWEKYQRGSAGAEFKPNPTKPERIARARYWNAMCQLRGVQDDESRRKSDPPIDPYVADPITNEPRNIHQPTWAEKLAPYGIILNPPS